MKKARAIKILKNAKKLELQSWNRKLKLALSCLPILHGAGNMNLFLYGNIFQYTTQAAKRYIKLVLDAALTLGKRTRLDCTSWNIVREWLNNQLIAKCALHPPTTLLQKRNENTLLRDILRNKCLAEADNLFPDIVGCYRIVGCVFADLKNTFAVDVIYKKKGVHHERHYVVKPRLSKKNGLTLKATLIPANAYWSWCASNNSELATRLTRYYA